MGRVKHPTILVFDGSIRVYEDGSMLDLHSRITPEEWELIVEETIKYKAFIECLKEIAIPTLKEKWEEEDDWFRIQLDVAVSRMRNIDALLVAKFDYKEIKKSYAESIKDSSAKMLKFIEEMRAEQKAILDSKLKDHKKSSKVSDL